MGFKPHFSHLPCDSFLSLNCFSMLPSAWTSVTVSHSTCSCLPLIRPSCSPMPNLHPRNHSHVLSDCPCQGPYGFCQTWLLLPMQGNVCPPGNSASSGHQNHSHLCTVALAMCQYDLQSFFLLSFNTTTSAKPCWHHLPGITEDHLALWLLPSLSKSCWKRRLKIETYQVVCDNAGVQGPHSISSYDTLKRGLKEPFCFSLRFTEVCSFLTQSPVLPKSYKRVLGSLEMLRFEYRNCQRWFVVWSVIQVNKFINAYLGSIFLRDPETRISEQIVN